MNTWKEPNSGLTCPRQATCRAFNYSFAFNSEFWFFQFKFHPEMLLCRKKKYFISHISHIFLSLPGLFYKTRNFLGWFVSSFTLLLFFTSLSLLSTPTQLLWTNSNLLILWPKQARASCSYEFRSRDSTTSKAKSKPEKLLRCPYDNACLNVPLFKGVWPKWCISA